MGILEEGLTWNTSWMSWPKDCESRVLMSTLLAWWRTCSRSGEDENSAASCRRLEALHSHSGSLNPPFSLNPEQLN